MRRTLLVTNDFPPRAGGIQSYLHALACRLPADRLAVYAPAWPGAAEFDAAQPFPVFRHPTSLMLPVPAVARRAAEIVESHRASAVWFGAAAPLALLAAGLRRHGVDRTVASMHGHEVGWSMLPGARQALRRIGATNDVLTYVSDYARSRTSAALGPMAALEYLPPGVDARTFAPNPAGRAAIRRRYRLGDAPVLVCVSRLVKRKGQDVLIESMAAIRQALPEAVLLIVSDGPDRKRLTRLAASAPAGSVVFTGSVTSEELPWHVCAGDVFAMPCRTRGGGLDVEGLGIVFLEASACALPVIAGDSGGAPEAVLDDQTGVVVDGRDRGAVQRAAIDLLGDAAKRARFGETGRRWVLTRWTWQRSADRLAELLG